jgi:beta-barrel assembly-enhancing protease
METIHTLDNQRNAAPLSRRRFLQGAVLVGGGLVLDPLFPSSAEAGGPIPMPTPAQQKKVGEEATQKILAQYRAVNDGRTQFFQNLGSRLVRALPSNERQLWDFQFYVLDSDDVNAFAVPGGHIFLFTGLFKRLDTEDAVAAVTAHEIAHVRKQHWAKAVVKQQERSFLFSLGLSILKGSREAAALAQLADTAIGLKYSRGDEDEADSAGLSNMVAANYNPNGMLSLLTTLQKIGGNGGSLVGDFLSDHPLTGDRISRTQRRIGSLQGSQTFPPQKPLRYGSLT